MENYKVNISRNSVAVIIGNDSDNGTSVAKDLLNNFNKVILVNNDWHILENVVARMQSEYQQERIVTIKADLNLTSDVAKLASTIYYKYGGVDPLIKYLDRHESVPNNNLEDALLSLQGMRKSYA